MLCADGAARRVRDMQLRRHADIAGSAEECIPDAIVGDMDSLDVETCEYYRWALVITLLSVEASY